MNITASFIPSGCTGYVQVLDVAINKPLKNRIGELADIHYEEHFEKWNTGSYTVGDRRIMLTKWVGQAWRELHTQQADVIRQTFRKLGLSLAVDGSEDHEISVKDIPGLEVGDWRLPLDQEDAQEVEEPVEDPGLPGIEAEVVDSGEREYVLNDEMDKGCGEQDDEVDGNSESEMEDGS